MSAITIAIEKHGAGQAGIARLLGVTPQAVNQWVTSNRPVPARHVLTIERATGVSRHALRPDVFGDTPATARAAAADIPVASSPQAVAASIDVRMSKRALRAKLGLGTDKQLAKVLQLPVEQVESWEEERALPAVPEVLRLLGVQPDAAPVQPPQDPDDDRIVPVEVA